MPAKNWQPTSKSVLLAPALNMRGLCLTEACICDCTGLDVSRISLSDLAAQCTSSAHRQEIVAPEEQQKL